MPSRDYRIYRINRAGSVLGAALIYSASADHIVVRVARRLRSAKEGVSVWQEARLVQELGPEPAAGD